MKTTIVWDQPAGQFRANIDGKRFYFGDTESSAKLRKAQLTAYRASIPEWTATTLETAKAIAKGKQVTVPVTRDEQADEDARCKLAEIGVAVKPFVTLADFDQVVITRLQKRVAELEAELKEVAGPRVAERSTITVAATFAEWISYRKRTAVHPGTDKPMDTVRGESTVVDFITRLLPPGLLLAQFDYAQIDMLCKAIASRPHGLKTGKPISRGWARAALKITRRMIRWAGRTYGYRRPADWEEATQGNVRWTKADQMAQQQVSTLRYTPDELRTLWRYAIPSEKLLLLLALNCGFRQREITALQPSEINGNKIGRYRDKSNIYGEWSLWPETVSALATTCRPAKQSKVTAAWQRLLKRVQKDKPDFRSLSFKRLCKTAASAIRRLAGGETASLFLAHAHTTGDDLLEKYAATDWARLDEALGKWRDEIAFGSVICPVDGRTAVPINKIEMARAMWKDNCSVAEIVSATGLSRATCYRYR